MRGPLGLILPVLGAVAVLATGCRGACCPCPCPPVPRCRLAVAATPAPPPLPPALAAARRHGSGLAAIWSHLAATYDADKDGRVVAAEYTRDEAVFKRLDEDEDGALTAADFRGPTTMDAYLTELIWRRLAAAEGEEGQPPFMRGPGPRPPLQAERVRTAFRKADANQDGVLREAELLAALERAQATPASSVPDVPAGVHEHASLRAVMDADHDGRVVTAELEAWIERAAAPPAPPAPPKPPGPRPPAPAIVAKVGEPAPDFTLQALDSAEPVTLASFRGKRPVALIFGSYTCPPFRHLARELRAAIDENLADVQFLFVYIREAHAVDGPAPMPAADQPLVEEPRTLEERRLVATQCAADLGLDRFPTLVDGIDNAVNRAYAAAPARLYVVDREGVVRYQGGPGPFGLDARAFADAVRAARAAP